MDLGHGAGAGPRLRGRIRALVSIAASNGSCLSMEQLSLLMPEDSFPDLGSLERFLRGDEVLARDLVVQGDAVAPRENEALISLRPDQVELTRNRLSVAKDFARGLVGRCPWIRFVGVTGSIAYDGTKPEDDVDIFVVVERGRLWITLLVALVTARVFRIRRPRAPVLCFNRMDDVDHCREIFRDLRDPLFAREALCLKVLGGGEFYADLLRQARWMRDYFPALYDRQLRGPPGGALASERRGRAWGALDLLAMAGLGPLLWCQGLVRNRRLQRAGRSGALFRTVVHRGYSAYESNKFDDLREEYRRCF